MARGIDQSTGLLAAVKAKLLQFTALSAPDGSVNVITQSGETVSVAQIVALAVAAVGGTVTPPVMATTGLVVVIGDSLPEGYNSESYIGWPKKMGYGSGVTINNAAPYTQGGHTVLGSQGIVADAADNLASQYQAGKTCVAVLERGRNDVRAGTAANTIYAEDTRLVALLKSQGWRVIICTLIDATDTLSAAHTDIQTALNNLRHANTAGADAVIEAAADSVLGVAGASSNTAYFNSDKLHLLDAGQQRFATTLAYPVINAQLLLPARSPSLVISGSPGTATVGTPYNYAPSVAGGAGTKTFALSGTALPAGLNWSPSTGVISGTPTAIANVSGIIITVSDSSGSASQTVSITVQANSGSSTAPLVLTNPTYGAGQFGQALTGGTGKVPSSVFPTGPIQLPCTIEMWAATTASGTQVLVGLKGNAGHAFYIGTGGGKPIASTGSAEGNVSADIAPGSAPVVNNGSFYHSALVLTTTGAHFYAAGVLVGSNSQVAVMAQSGVQMDLLDLAGGFNWNGALDDLVISAGEKYSGNTYTVPSAAAAAAGAIAVYHFDGNGNAASS